MAWSWTAWAVSAAAVLVSALIAWLEGGWKRRPGLAMGFANHGGMWSDLVLLSMANAVIAPYVTVGRWLVPAVLISTIASVLVHIHWYRGPRAEADGSDCDAAPAGNHMWLTHARGSWWRDLSWSGWAHVLYVIGELALLTGFAVHDAPADVVLFVALIFTIHVPIGLLQPRYFLTGHIATVSEQPLLLPCLLALWAAVAGKL